MAPPTEDPREILLQSRTVAVLGAHHDANRAACYVPEYLHAMGYRVIAVNPAYVGETWWGQPVRATLAEISESIDLVDIFRRSELLPDHLTDILSMRPLPRWVWLQLGIRNDEFAQALRAAGIGVVQSRCTLADHRNFGLGPVP